MCLTYATYCGFRLGHTVGGRSEATQLVAWILRSPNCKDEDLVLAKWDAVEMLGFVNCESRRYHSKNWLMDFLLYQVFLKSRKDTRFWKSESWLLLKDSLSLKKHVAFTFFLAIKCVVGNQSEWAKHISWLEACGLWSLIVGQHKCYLVILSLKGRWDVVKVGQMRNK